MSRVSLLNQSSLVRCISYFFNLIYYQYYRHNIINIIFTNKQYSSMCQDKFTGALDKVYNPFKGLCYVLLKCYILLRCSPQQLYQLFSHQKCKSYVFPSIHSSIGSYYLKRNPCHLRDERWYPIIIFN